jgi:hypothetical protein
MPRPRISAPKDFCAALIYLGVGVATLLIGREYKMGTAVHMGPAYFPTLLALLLLLIGTISLVRSFLQDGEPIPAFAWKPLGLIVAATIVFGLIVKGAGLLIALPLFVIMTAHASVKFRWVPTLALAAGATLFCTLVFVKGLGVSLPLVGRWFAGWLA